MVDAEFRQFVDRNESTKKEGTTNETFGCGQFNIYALVNTAGCTE